MRRPFTLYKENTKSGTFWYARYWDETLQKYKHSRSTGVPVEGKKERRYEAEEKAKKILDELSEMLSKATAPQPTAKRNTVASTPFLRTCLERSASL